MSCAFLWQNLFDTATVTASSEAADFPVTNLQNRWKDSEWRSTAVSTDQWIKANLGSSPQISHIVLLNHNARLAQTIKLQANDTDVWTAPAVDISITITADMVSNEILVYNYTGTSYQWWRTLIVADSGNPDGYFCGTRVGLYNAFIPERNFTKDYSIEPVDPSTISESDYGQQSVNARDTYLHFVLPFKVVNTDYLTFWAMGEWNGKKQPFFFIADTSDLINETYYVHCTSGWPLQHVYNKKLWDTTLVLDEEL